jgi:hypothetical protein
VTGAPAEGATPRDAAIVADACVDAARRILTELLASFDTLWQKLFKH